MATERGDGSSESQDEISEEVIRSNVITYQNYLEKSIAVKDFVGHFNLLEREQRNELLQIAKTNPTGAARQAFENLDQLSHPHKYTHLLETLDKAGYPKLVGLLKGNIFYANDNHRRRFNEVTPSIYHRLNPSEAVPFLQQKGVISHDEAAEIRNIETQKSRSHAALELQYILPNRQRHWYELTIRSLVESEQCELAEEIDAKLTKAILDNADTDLSLSDDQISLISDPGREDVTKSGHKYRGWRSRRKILKSLYRAIKLEFQELKEKLKENLKQVRRNKTLDDLLKVKDSCRKEVERFRQRLNYTVDKLQADLIVDLETYESNLKHAQNHSDLIQSDKTSAIQNRVESLESSKGSAEINSRHEQDVYDTAKSTESDGVSSGQADNISVLDIIMSCK